jgi:hypothetical protein
VLAVLRSGPAGIEPVDRGPHRAVLLVPRHDLDLAALQLHEQREVPHQIQQPGRVQHPRDQALLRRQLPHAKVGHRIVFGYGRRGLPLGEMLPQRGERAYLRRLEACGHHELVGVEQPLATLRLHRAALVRVAAQLLDRIPDRVRLGWGLRFDHDQRDAVDEQDGVWVDRCTATRRIHSELVDHKELVALQRIRGLPVDEMDGPGAPTVPTVLTVHGDAKQKLLGQLLVDLQQGSGLGTGELGDRLVDPPIVEPLVAVVVQVDSAQGGTESVEQEYLTEALPPRGARQIGFGRLDMLPVHTSQLPHQRQLNPLVLRPRIHDATPPPPSPALVPLTSSPSVPV